MTRDNLIAIADKFQLFPEKRALMSATELVELMKKSTKIAPINPVLDFKQRTRAALENPTIVFSVGFEYNDPAVATRVANELMTRILNEDLRDRTTRATDTTRFLFREVQRLQTQNATLDAKIAQLRLAQGKASSGPTSDQPSSTLAQLKAELIQKGALYTDKHPVVQSLKRQIQAMESVAQTPAPSPEAATAASLDALVAQQESLQKNLETATAKLMAARLGENLEKDQQSEKLEVIEQPTVPQDPIKPNRPKLLAVAIVLAFGAGAGLTFLLELMDKAIRRSSDIYAAVDSRLVVSIPYITTKAELQRKKRVMAVGIGCAVVFLVATGIAAYIFMSPLDLMFAKARAGLFR
jgi:uncharacterized protein involved in exopolysaccharide biosynthesis